MQKGILFVSYINKSGIKAAGNFAYLTQVNITNRKLCIVAFRINSTSFLSFTTAVTTSDEVEFIISSLFIIYVN